MLQPDLKSIKRLIIHLGLIRLILYVMINDSLL